MPNCFKCEREVGEEAVFSQWTGNYYCSPKNWGECSRIYSERKAEGVDFNGMIKLALGTPEGERRVEKKHTKRSVNKKVKVVSEFYDAPCQECKGQIPRTGKRGRPPKLCSDCRVI